MKLLLQGGQVVSGAGVAPLDVLISGETIEAVGPDLSCPDAQVVDVSGKLLFPGFIDAHTHFDLDVCNTTAADDFATGTRAALRGGTTTVIDFACPNKGETLQYGLQLWHQKADGKSSCDYGFHMTIDDWNEGIRQEIPEMLQAGIPTFKMYMTYPAMMIGDRDLFLALEELGKYGAFAGVHCENSGVIDALIAQKKAAGETGPASHPATRPNALEAEAVGSLLRMAQVAQVPVMIVHLSTHEALEEVRAARQRGQTVYVETCPQYLLLDRSLYEHPDYSQAARFICAPPLREQADREALWAALADGTIQTVSTDHCSFTLAQKDAGKGDFTQIPGGLPGVESRGILLWSEGVARGRIDVARMCALLSETPARLYGAYPQKGVIRSTSGASWPWRTAKSASGPWANTSTGLFPSKRVPGGTHRPAFLRSDVSCLNRRWWPRRTSVHTGAPSSSAISTATTRAFAPCWRRPASARATRWSAWATCWKRAMPRCRCCGG